MNIHPVDYAIIVVYFASTLVVGWLTMRRASTSSSEFFLSGQTMPWWLLGFSMVATTFSPSTPNLITDIVRQHGISGNWVWWVFLITGMLTVFIYAKLWRRIGVMTDIEFYEVRYSGASGAFLRGFRTVYLGLIVNTVIMATVTLALMKILGVMFGTAPLVTVVIASVVSVLFSACGGFAAVIWTDFILFIVAMTGAVGAAIYVLGMPEVGGLHGLVTHENVTGSLAFFPDLSNSKEVLTILIVPFAVLWWSTWYPGSEPGGGSYTAQRMIAAKNEAHAVGATLFFNFCHYVLRPWAWLLVALASLIVFPTLDSLRAAFPNLPEKMIAHDLAYPAMLFKLPAGLLGIFLASMFAAYMSTISTFLNLGSCYMVNDWYRRFWNRQASEKQLVFAGRLWTVLLMILAASFSFVLKNALQAFQILMLIGAGTGLLFLLRWFWWRINAWSEISAMAISFGIALYFKFVHVPLWITTSPDGVRTPQWLDFSDSMQLIISVLVTTIGWVVVTFLTRPTDEATLRDFIRRSRAGGPGWKRIVDRAKSEGVELEDSRVVWSVPTGILCTVFSCTGIYAALFATGAFLYGDYVLGSVLSGVFVLGMLAVVPLWKRLA